MRLNLLGRRFLLIRVFAKPPVFTNSRLILLFLCHLIELVLFSQVFHFLVLFSQVLAKRSFASVLKFSIFCLILRSEQAYISLYTLNLSLESLVLLKLVFVLFCSDPFITPRKKNDANLTKNYFRTFLKL